MPVRGRHNNDQTTTTTIDTHRGKERRTNKNKFEGDTNIFIPSVSFVCLYLCLLLRCVGLFELRVRPSRIAMRRQVGVGAGGRVRVRSIGAGSID